jgi:hypothetical protein
VKYLQSGIILSGTLQIIPLISICVCHLFSKSLSPSGLCRFLNNLNLLDLIGLLSGAVVHLSSPFFVWLRSLFNSSYLLPNMLMLRTGGKGPLKFLVSSSLTQFIPSLCYFRTFISFRSISKSCIMVAVLAKFNIMPSIVITENLLSNAQHTHVANHKQYSFNVYYIKQTSNDNEYWRRLCVCFICLCLCLSFIN